jgi:molybdopterin molybdotransferase
VAELLSLEEAQRRILERVVRLPAEQVSLQDAAGRVTAADVPSRVDLPPFDSSAMDGFALRAADTPGRLPVVERIAAGRPASRALVAGEAMAIATGGAIPDGANAVIPIEYVVDHGNEVETAERVDPGADIRPRGGDIRAGQVVVPSGMRLGPAQLGALAAAGAADIPATRRPRAAVLSTGTELRTPGTELEPGQIYEANGVLLAAQLATAGADVERLEPVADDEAAHRAALQAGLEADVLVSSGGVSVGPHDLVRSVGGELGVEEVLWGVAVKPGKPLSFGVRGTSFVFGLPGNPVSSLVACAVFVVPAIEALQGLTEPGPRFEWGRLASQVRRDPHRDVFLRALAKSSRTGVSLAPVQGQESHMITRAAGANALALARRGEGTLPAGTAVEFLRL